MIPGYIFNIYYIYIIYIIYILYIYCIPGILYPPSRSWRRRQEDIQEAWASICSRACHCVGVQHLTQQRRQRLVRCCTGPCLFLSLHIRRACTYVSDVSVYAASASASLVIHVKHGALGVCTQTFGASATLCVPFFLRERA